MIAIARLPLQCVAMLRTHAGPWIKEPRKAGLRTQLLDLIFLYKRDGAFPEYYFTYRAYREESQPRAMLPPGLVDKARDHLNRAGDRQAVRDKQQFRLQMEALGLPVVRELLVTDGQGGLLDPDGKSIHADSLDALVKSQTAPLFIKPLDGALGLHSSIWRPGTPFVFPNQWMRWIVQPAVEQHPVLASLHPQSVNTLRIMSFAEEGHTTLELAFLRMGSAGSCVDNGGAGGLMASVDLQTGTVFKPAVRSLHIDPMLTPHTHHPETGTRIIGLQLPWLAETKTIVEKAARALGRQGFVSLGWDVIFGRDGPILLEANDGWFAYAPLILHPFTSSRLGEVTASRPWRHQLS